MEAFLVVVMLIAVSVALVITGFVLGHDAGYRLRDSEVLDPFEDDDDDWGDDDEYWEPTESASEDVSNR